MRRVLSLTAMLFIVTTSFAQLHFDATLATNHLWRGGEVASGLVITSSVSVTDSKERFTGGFWGGTNATGEYKEFNSFVSYTSDHVTVELWDTYNFSTFATYNNQEFFNYNTSTTGRFLDATVKYRFDEEFPLHLSWSTILFGRDRNAENTENRFSTYCYAEYPIYDQNSWRADGGMGVAFALNPEGSRANFYGTQGGVVHVSLKITRKVRIVENYTLPISFLSVWNPQDNSAYMQLSAEIFSF